MARFSAPRTADGDVSILIKQAPMAVLFGVAVVLVAVIPDLVSSIPAVLIGTALVLAATVLAAVLNSRGHVGDGELIVPAVDFLALGALRFGTGGPGSVFVAFVVLPVVWMAMREGRRHAVYAAIGTAVALFLPLLVGANILERPTEWIRALLSPTVFFIAAVMVNELATQSRQRLDSVRSLAREREGMLEDSRARTRVLAAREAQLRELESFMRNVWEATTEQIVVGTDLTGRIDLWNTGARRILETTIELPEETRYIDEFLLERELDERADHLEVPAGGTMANPHFVALIEAAKEGRPDAGEWTAVRHDGTLLPIHLSVTPRKNDAGVPVGYLFIGLDLTREREASRLKDEFVGLISHELRTPLSSILGYLELLRDDDETALGESQLQYLSVAERNANRLLRLVGDLLFTAQVDSGKFRVDRAPVALDAIVENSLETARPVAASAGVEIAADIPRAVVAELDAVRIGQAIDNLVSNAVKFTPRGGLVTVRVSADDDDVIISVSDTGIGIPADELDKLFGRFFRASTATRNAVPGVGLGLVITRAIVQAHGGTMDVRSTVGEGTTFEMRLSRSEPGTKDETAPRDRRAQRSQAECNSESSDSAREASSTVHS